MKKLDTHELIEMRELAETQELKERINKILRMLKEDEPVEVIEHDKVIKHIVLPDETKQERDAAAWDDLKRIASKLAPYWADENVDSVEIVHEVRRDL